MAKILIGEEEQILIGEEEQWLTEDETAPIVVAGVARPEIPVALAKADFKISTDGILGQMALEPADSFFNNIFLSLMIPRGGWFLDRNFGSRLHLLQRAKNTAKTAARAVEYCKEALQWLLDSKRAIGFDFATERDLETNMNRLKISIEATRANGQIVTFQTFVEVV